MQLTEQEKTQLNDWIDELNDYKTKIAHFESDANVAIGNMNEYIQKYNNVLKNVDAFATQITGRFEAAQQEKPRAWDESEEGQKHKQAHTKWEVIDLLSVDLVEEVNIEDLNHPTEIGGLPIPK